MKSEMRKMITITAEIIIMALSVRFMAVVLSE